MNPPFTLFNGSITATTNTPEFECSAAGLNSPASMAAFILRMNVSALGASQTVKPVLQGKLPDGTWLTLDTTQTPVSANGETKYLMGRNFNSPGSGWAGAYGGGVPRTCRFQLQVVNANNATVQIDILPIDGP